MATSQHLAVRDAVASLLQAAPALAGGRVFENRDYKLATDAASGVWVYRDDSTPAPPNGYRSVRFRTTFANNRSATEVLALSREGDRWRVVGITVE